jgi:signal transduction histidine kinase
MTTAPGGAPAGARYFARGAAPARPHDRRLALAVFLVSTLLFFFAAPYAKLPLPQVWAFLPAYQSALVINDLITATVLFGQFAILRSSALLVLACGYLFCALMAAFHALSFPGLFAPHGLLGSGPQTTAWIYFIWHGIFPLSVIAYTLLRGRPPAGKTPARAYAMSAIAIAATIGVVAVFVLATTTGHDLLPAIMMGNSDLAGKLFIAGLTWMLCLVALFLLMRRRRQTVLDLWLAVVMFTWALDIALAAVLNGARFDFGWYAGRVYGLAAGSFVLFVLLLENGMLVARLVQAYKSLGEVNRELEAFSYSVSHDLRSPLRAIDGYARMLEEDYAGKIDAEGERLLGVVREEALRMGRLIDGLLNYSRLGRQAITAGTVDSDRMVDEIFATLSHEYDISRVAFVHKPLARASGDSVLLRQVWANLLGNALKYSSKREAPAIEVGSYTEGSNNVFYVKDNGAGFDMKYSSKLFGVFQRMHEEEEFTGAGVGLAIVHKVVTRHGGTVWAEAAVDAGATFYFSLPDGGLDGTDERR